MLENMGPSAQRVLEESREFRRRLSELVALYEGRWVVFRGGRVVSDYGGEEEAYVAAVQRFGVRGGVRGSARARRRVRSGLDLRLLDISLSEDCSPA